VQRRIGKGRVKLAREGKPRAVGNARVESSPLRRRDHLRGGIDAHHDRARGGNFLAQHAVTASEVQDALAGKRLEQIEHGLPERWNEVRVLRITVRLPALRGRRAFGRLWNCHGLNIY